MKTVIGLAWVCLSIAFVWALLDHAHDGEDAAETDDEDPPIYAALVEERYLAWLERDFHDSSP